MTKVFKRRTEDLGIVARTMASIYTLAGGFLDFIDKRQIIRRAAFLWVLWLTGEVVYWTMNFAWYSTRPGMEVAAVIAAVWAPLGVLQGAVFKFYDEKQKEAA